MGVLGKDLVDLHRPQTNTKVEFGASVYWVEDRPEPQPYGAVLTEVLNLDVAPFQELLDQLNTAVQEKSNDVLRAYMDMKKRLASLPLYRLYLEDFRVFGDMPVEAFAVGEAQDAFAAFMMQEDNDLPAFMQQQINDIRLIQERYAWFLDGVFADAVFEKKKGQKKIPLAPMICSRGYEAFISGVSLGENPETDAPPVKTQYRIRGEKEKAEIVEKMYFDRLLDFVYVEFMKGLQKGFVPKRCANCGRWFLQKPGATYAYCTGPAPGPTRSPAGHIPRRRSHFRAACRTHVPPAAAPPAMRASPLRRDALSASARCSRASPAQDFPASASQIQRPFPSPQQYFARNSGSVSSVSSFQ